MATKITNKKRKVFLHLTQNTAYCCAQSKPKSLETPKETLCPKPLTLTLTLKLPSNQLGITFILEPSSQHLNLEPTTSTSPHQTSWTFLHPTLSTTPLHLNHPLEKKTYGLASTPPKPSTQHPSKLNPNSQKWPKPYPWTTKTTQSRKPLP